MNKKAQVKLIWVSIFVLLFVGIMFVGSVGEEEKPIIKKTFYSDTRDNLDGTFSLTMYPDIRYFNEIVNLTETDDGFSLKWYDKEVKIIKFTILKYWNAESLL